MAKILIIALPARGEADKKNPIAPSSAAHTAKKNPQRGLPKKIITTPLIAAKNASTAQTSHLLASHSFERLDSPDTLPA
jgi:hypothetical protein